jgi:hypothetical protein
MTDALDKQRLTHDRRNDPPPSGRVAPQAPERGATYKGTPDVLGNPGLQVGTETRNGLEYVRYRAVKGTWVSASLAEQGYDKVWDRKVAYGAYIPDFVRNPDGTGLKNPDKIVPGQEYLVPSGAPPKQVISFPEESITTFRPPPKAKLVEPFEQGTVERKAKDFGVGLAKDTVDLPYGTFELRGPEPPSREPEDAVVFWLKLHKSEIERAEKTWRVSRLAIAGAIAWEALINPQAFSPSSSSVAKIHLEGRRGHLSWLQGLELTGLSDKSVRTRGQWRAFLANPENAIDILGRIFALIAAIAETKGWNLRNNPEILTHVYHSRAPDQWLEIIKAKRPGEGFGIQPGGMGKWVDDHQTFLKLGVGEPGRW